MSTPSCVHTIMYHVRTGCILLCRRNILGTSDAEFLKGCTFDPSTKDGLYCPIFSLKQIVDMIRPRENFTELSIKVGIHTEFIAGGGRDPSVSPPHAHRKRGWGGGGGGLSL